jgi:hypothetical protein
MIILREVIASMAASPAILEVIARNAPHFPVISVSVQKRPTKAKKIGVGHAVVFENDAFLNMLEKPRDGTADPETAPLIDIHISLLDITLPIDLFVDYLTCMDHFFEIIRI